MDVEKFIYRAVLAVIVGTFVSATVASAPDIKRYAAMRKM